MSFWNLVICGIAYYWRWHLGLLAGVAITSAIVSGSLIVGDSVKATLKRQNEVRLGKVSHAVVGGDRFFTEALVEKLAAGYGDKASLTGMLVLRGTVSTASGGKRINNVNVIGVNPDFWKLGLESDRETSEPAGLLVNEALAGSYGLAAGETVIVRVEKPGALSRDAPLSGSKEDLVSLRKEIAGTVAPEHGGNFSLRAEQLPPLNVFVPLAELQELVGEQGRVNLLAASAEGAGTLLEDTLSGNLQNAWQLADAELALDPVAEGTFWNLSSSRVFIDPVIETAVAEIEPDSIPVLTYLVNRISRGDAVTPYSMATALPLGYHDVLPKDTGGHEVVVNQWLADDLGASAGDTVALSYFVLAEGRQLKEETTNFVVKAVLPMDHPAMNPTWTPDFPGVSEKDSCSEWDPGYEVDFNLIREKDEAYWDDHKATPKAFLPIETGRNLWSNRFGNVTGIRFPSTATSEEQFLARLKEKLTAGSFGLSLVNTKAAARQAVAQALPLEQYFLSFGFFLILTALVLAALLFLFSMENRSAQIGVLSAVGIPRKTVRRLFLVEGLGISVLGALAGLAGGVLYTKLILAGLSSGWSDAVAGLKFDFAMKPVSLVAAFAGTVFMALATVFLASRRILNTLPKDLLAGSGVQARPWAKWTRRLVWIGLIAWGLSTVLGIGYMTLSADATLGAWFLAGAALLILGLMITGSILKRAGRHASPDGHVSVWQMGLRNAVRKPGRSLAIAGILSAGIFMITVVNLFRQDATRDATERAAGTGGFAFVGESSMPVYEDLNTDAGRAAFSIDAAEMEGASVAPFRVQEGDEASCLNLNQAQVPAVAGVDPSKLAARGAFTFSALSSDVTVASGASPWTALDANLAGGAIPAIMDMNSAKYALKIGLGETIPYTDGKGNNVPLRLVGMLGNSLLQGKVIISEENFINNFPAAGYRYFLVDAEPARAGEVAETLTKQLGILGLSLTPAAARLGQFNAVQNTYIGIFSTLGAFALVLSTAGLGILVARNVLERRAEFGILQAVGFRKPALRGIVLGEHWFLLLSGLLIGLLSAVIAVWPMLKAGGSAGISVGFVGFLFVGILAGGLAFCWIAASLALRMPLLEAIRKE